MMKNIAPYISVPAGLISITNFVFTILPAQSVPNWWIQLSSIYSPFRFLIFAILSFLACFLVSKFLSFLIWRDFTFSVKHTFYAITVCSFSWVIVYNTKFMMLNNSLEGDNKVIFWIASFVFYCFCNIILNKDLENEGYHSEGGVFEYTLLDLIVSRAIFFWLVFIFLGFYYTIPYGIANL